MDYIDRYSSSTLASPSGDNVPHHLLHPTIAIVPFMSYVKKGSGQVTLDRSTNLTIASLGATLASMARVGFGRIVVVGLDDGDECLVREAFELLPSSNNSKNQNATDYAYVQIRNETWYRTKFIPYNVPRAAITGLQHAFRGELPEGDIKLWLGNDKEYWKYVYLTEPDTILQTRMSSLEAIHDALEEKLVLMPHRLQPVPHYTDVEGTSSLNYLKQLGAFRDKVVIELDQENDACCEEVARPYSQFGECRNFWYMCGFASYDCRDKNASSFDEGHKRLIPYDLIRIRGGTGIVSVAGSVHGRSCRPERRPGFVCEAPYRTEISSQRW